MNQVYVGRYSYTFAPDNTVYAELERDYRWFGELVVYGFFNTDGATDVSVRSGPCAPAYTSFDPDLYQPEG